MHRVFNLVTNALYKLTGWKTISVRWEVDRLAMIYIIINNQAADFLHELVPELVYDISNYNLRIRHNIIITVNRLSV